MDPRARDGALVWELRTQRVCVLESDQVASLLGLDNRVLGDASAWQDSGDRGFQEPDVLRLAVAAHLDLGVGEFGVRRDREVRGERPRCCGPNEEGLVGPLQERELDVDRRVRLVGVLDLGIREGRLISRAPLRGTQRLVDPAALVGPLERPPCALDPVVPDRHVRALPIQPDPEGLELRRHLVQEVEGEGPARVHELLNPELLDLLLVCDAEGLLDLDLDRKAVHVVARLVPDVMSAHPLVADHEILDRLVQDVPEMDRPRREWRSVTEVEVFVFLPGGHRFRVDLRPLPEFLDLPLHLAWSVRLLRLLDHRSPAPRGRRATAGLLHRLGAAVRSCQ